MSPWHGLEEIKTCLASGEGIKDRPSCCTAIEVATTKDATGFGAAVSLRSGHGSRKGKIKEEDERKDRGDPREREEDGGNPRRNLTHG